MHAHEGAKRRLAEMSTDEDWIRTEANFGRIRTGTDCNFFENLRIRIVSENFLLRCDYSNRIKNFSCNVTLQIC